MNVVGSQPKPSSVLDQVADAAAPARELMWPAVGAYRHLVTAAVLLAITVLANCNTLTTRYVLMDRSGFTLDSRYIIELDPRSRARQWSDRGEMQKELFVRAASAMQAEALYQKPADLAALSKEAAELAHTKDEPATATTQPAGGPKRAPSDIGFVNYFTKDYWWPKGISGLYRPLTSITYHWNFAPIREVTLGEWEQMYKNEPDKYYQIHARSLVRFHWTNTILHWVAATLAYFMMLALCGRYWAAALAAGMFCVHPIAVESVANIIGRADIFAAIWTFATLLCYIRSTKVSGVSRLPWLFAATVCLTIGVFCKESALAAGPLVAAYEVIYLYRPRVNHLFVDVRNWFDDLTRLGGDFLAACVRFAFRGWVWLIPPVIAVFYVRHLIFAASTPPEEPFLDNPIRGHPWDGLEPNPVLNLIESRVTALKVSVLLLWKMIFPVFLSSDYSFNQIAIFNVAMTSLSDWGGLLAALLVLGFLGWGICLWARGSRAAAYMIFFYFLALLPTSNLIKVIGSIMAERFMYLPLFGFVGGVSLLLFAVSDRLLKSRPGQNDWMRWLPHAAGSVLIVLYGARTLARNQVWRSDEKLWEAAKPISPKSFRCYQSYAFALYENAQIDKLRGKLTDEQYKQQVQKMIDVDEEGLKIVDVLPDEMNSARLYLHLGMYYAEMGRLHLKPTGELTDEARKWYEKSVAILQRAIPIDKAFNRLNRRKEIMRGKPINEIPDAGLAPVYMILADSQIHLNQLEEAIETFRYVQQLDPMAAVSYLQIGAIRMNQGRIDDAVTHLIQTVMLEPTRAEPWPMLQNIYQALGTPEAVVINGESRQVNAAVPIVQQHVRNALRELVRSMIRARNLEFARTLRKQAIDVHKVPAGVMDLLFSEAGVPIEPPAKEVKKWR